MAYVVVSFKGQEVGRWPLSGPLTVGRSTECDVVVRDILLSRRHCEIAPYRNGWVAVDLGSMNGTRAGRHPITRRGLSDGDVLTLGKTTIKFRMGRLPAEHKPPAKRPADPFEALAGTVTDFDPRAAEAFCRANHMPSPRPVPPVPAAFARDDLYSLLTEIASSSWDSIYAQASRPKRPIPRAHLKAAGPNTAPVGATAGLTAAAPAPAEETRLTRRTRLGFAEELQVKPAGHDRVVRPATPHDAGLTDHKPLRPEASTAGSRSGGPNDRSRKTAWSMVRRPLAALHRWIAPAGRVRLF